MSLSFKKVVLMSLAISAGNVQAMNATKSTKTSYDWYNLYPDTMGAVAGLSFASAIAMLKYNQAYAKEIKQRLDTCKPENRALIALTSNATQTNNKMAALACLGAGLMSLGVSTLGNTISDRNNRDIQDSIQTAALGCCTGLIMYQAAEGHLSATAAAAGTAALVSGYVVAKTYLDVGKRTVTLGTAGAAVLTAGLEYSSDNGTNISLFGLPIWSSTISAQETPSKHQTPAA